MGRSVAVLGLAFFIVSCGAERLLKRGLPTNTQRGAAVSAEQMFRTVVGPNFARSCNTSCHGNPASDYATAKLKIRAGKPESSTLYLKASGSVGGHPGVWKKGSEQLTALTEWIVAEGATPATSPVVTLDQLYYYKYIYPILGQNYEGPPPAKKAQPGCLGCHEDLGKGPTKSDFFDYNKIQTMVVPGHPDKSLLYRRAAHIVLPDEKDHAFNFVDFGFEKELDLIKKWIQGAAEAR